MMTQTAILRMPDVRAEVGLSKSTIYALIDRGEFPAPIQLSTRAVGWERKAVELWLAKRADATRNKPKSRIMKGV
jgi:prophage regulatory protein